MSTEITPVYASLLGAVMTPETLKTSSGTGFSELLNASKSSGTDLDDIFERAAQKYDLPVGLLKAVAKAESNFRPDATSKCGAMGIMQLMPGTARALGVTDAYDPEQNIMGGAKYLRQMLDKFEGDASLALAAYNAGPGAVTKYGGIPPYKETQNYVTKVLGYAGTDISAGSVTYSGGAAESAGTPSKSGDTDLMRALKEMMILKILEMQMSSSEDDGDKYKKIF